MLNPTTYCQNSTVWNIVLGVCYTSSSKDGRLEKKNPGGTMEHSQEIVNPLVNIVQLQYTNCAKQCWPKSWSLLRRSYLLELDYTSFNRPMSLHLSWQSHDTCDYNHQQLNTVDQIDLWCGESKANEDVDMFTAADTGLVYSYCTYYKLIQLLRETPEEYIINLIRPRKILWTQLNKDWISQWSATRTTPNG